MANLVKKEEYTLELTKEELKIVREGVNVLTETEITCMECKVETAEALFYLLNEIE